MNLQSIPITHLKQGPFIELYQLETMNDDVFKIYQRYDFYQILWFTHVEGNKSYFIDFIDYTYQSNQALVIYPGQIDRIYLDDKKGYLFAVDKETFFKINKRINSKYLSGYFSNVFISISEKTTTNLNNLIQLIELEYKDENRFFIIETYLSAFLFEMAYTFDLIYDQSKHSINNTANELKNLIEANYTIKQNTSFYASKLGITNKKLNEVTLKSFGSTVKQLLQEALLLAIKRELKLGEKSIKEIAFDLGFEDPAYLTRFFKKHTGTNPSSFRHKRK